MTFEEFKRQNGIKSIEVRKGSGRAFADYMTSEGTIERLFFSQDADLKKPLFVNRGVHDALWVGNKQSAEVIATL